MKTMVRREGDRIWLEGVEDWSDLERHSSVQAAQAAILAALGEDVSYDYLMGASGLAFRMQIHLEGFCPSSPHAACGLSCLAGADRALPWHCEPRFAKPDDTEEVAALRRRVAESIGRGIPVQYGSEEDGVIVGCRKDGTEWTCLHPWRSRGKMPFVETEWPWGIVFFTERKSSLSPRKDLAERALGQAVQMARAGAVSGYYVGFFAWEAFIERVAALDSVDEKTRAESQQGNFWNYACLVGYRRCAAQYLKLIAPDFGVRAQACLRAAADIYDEMANRILTGDRRILDIAPAPRSLPPGQVWTREHREEEGRRLKAAYALEQSAIAEIAGALS